MLTEARAVGTVMGEPPIARGPRKPPGDRMFHTLVGRWLHECVHV